MALPEREQAREPLQPVQALEQAPPRVPERVSPPAPEPELALEPEPEPVQAGSQAQAQLRAATKRLHSYSWVPLASSSCIRQLAVPLTR